MPTDPQEPLELSTTGASTSITAFFNTATNTRIVNPPPQPEHFARLAVVDTETSGLDIDRHAIWEVALFLPNVSIDGHGPWWEWFLPIEEGAADPQALKIGRYFERHPRHVNPGADSYHPEDAETVNPKRVTNPRLFAAQFARLTHGRSLINNVISFDAARLERLLRQNGACPAWDHHLIDTLPLVAGKLGIAPPWSTRKLSEAIGVAPPAATIAHTARADAEWAWELYKAAMGLPR